MVGQPIFSGSYIIKLFMAVINSTTKKASVFVKAIRKRLTNTLAYYTTQFITAMKSFLIQAPGVLGCLFQL